MQCNERMHLSRGAKRAPDLNIHGRAEEKGETKVGLLPGSKILRITTWHFSLQPRAAAIQDFDNQVFYKNVFVIHQVIEQSKHYVSFTIAQLAA